MAAMNQPHPTPDSHSPGRPLAGLLAEFADEKALKHAAAELRKRGFQRWDAYSPYPVHGLERAMGIRRTVLPWIVFAAAVAGGAAAVLLQWWTNAVDYPLRVSGKPYFSLPANIPIIFELVVLVAALAAFVGVLALNGLPRFSHPLFAVERFRRVTTDGFFLFIEAADAAFDESACRTLFGQLGAVAVEEVPAVAQQPIPRGIYWAVALLAVAAALPPLGVAWYRAVPKRQPRIHPVLDMDIQPKLKPQAASVLFAGRPATAMQPDGTVGAGQLYDDDGLYRGKAGEAWVDQIPLPVTMDLMVRGQQRFGIYCAPCHGLTGGAPDGLQIDDPTKLMGMTARRALKRGEWIPPLSLHSQQVREQPVGQIFHTITNGVRTMPGYGSQIPVEDRWAIVLYVRALQRSGRATLDDVPPERREQIR